MGRREKYGFTTPNGVSPRAVATNVASFSSAERPLYRPGHNVFYAQAVSARSFIASWFMPSLGLASALFLISTHGFARSNSDQAGPQTPTISLVEHADFAKLHQICECWLYLDPHSSQPIFGTYGHRTRALMRLDGKLVSLANFGSSGDEDCAVGKRHEQNWRGLGIRAVIKLQVDSLGEEAESCWYHGQVKVTTPRGQTTRTVKGACGC